MGRFLEWLTLIFIAAKLFGVIDWSWWLVLSPVWSVMAVIVIFYMIAFLFLAVDLCIFEYRHRKRKE